MRIETKTYYDEQDFENCKDSLTLQECIDELEWIASDYFCHFSYPAEGKEVEERDYDDYRKYCILHFAIDRLKENLKKC
jgi:hypothetical protein